MQVQSEPLPGGEIARKAVRAVAWNYIGWFLAKVVVLASTAVLARLLTPEDFGVVGFAAVVISFLAVLQELGLGSALIQRRGGVDDAADTVFTFNLMVGAALTLVVLGLAPSVASFFDEPQVTPLLQALSATFLLNALATTHITLLRRDLAFARKAIPDIGSSVVKGLVGVLAAVAGYGVWSLVLAQLAGSVAAVLLSWSVIPWRPRIRIQVPLLRSLTRFGGTLMVADIVHALVANLDYVIVGRVLGGTALGIYVLAYRLPELLLIGFASVLNQAVFPAFASVQDRPEALRRGFLATVRYSSMVVVPIGLGLIVAADPIVSALLGDRWIEAIPVLRVVAASALISSLMVSDGDLYKATGRPQLLSRFAMLKLALLVPALLVGVQYGLLWVAVAHLATTLVVKLARAVLVARTLQLRPKELIGEMSPVVRPALAMVVVTTVLLVLTESVDPWPRLLLVSVIGAMAYVIPLVRGQSDAVRHLRSLFGKNDQLDPGDSRYREVREGGAR